jgi:hypothetical protein
MRGIMTYLPCFNSIKYIPGRLLGNNKLKIIQCIYFPIDVTQPSNGFDRLFHLTGETINDTIPAEFTLLCCKF